VPDPADTATRERARTAFGSDPAVYEAGRPDYPDEVYRILVDRCGLRPGISILESGPGTGQVTRHLVDAGAHVTAAEPDPALCEFLRGAFPSKQVEVIESTFEDATFDADSFDLVAAATSFHWVDQSVGLPKIGHIARPGGWVALWWTSFGDPDRADPFHDATRDLLGGMERPPGSTPEFHLLREDREADLRQHAQLVDVRSELIPWTTRMNPRQVRSLYASLFNIIQRPVDERMRLLDTLEAIASNDFGAVVERPFVTVLYTGRR
jgi:SAM-dependent methyltransferase